MVFFQATPLVHVSPEGTSPGGPFTGTFMGSKQVPASGLVIRLCSKKPSEHEPSISLADTIKKQQQQQRMTNEVQTLIAFYGNKEIQRGFKSSQHNWKISTLQHTGVPTQMKESKISIKYQNNWCGAEKEKKNQQIVFTARCCLGTHRPWQQRVFLGIVSSIIFSFSPAVFIGIYCYDPRDELRWWLNNNNISKWNPEIKFLSCESVSQ